MPGPHGRRPTVLIVALVTALLATAATGELTGSHPLAAARAVSVSSDTQLDAAALYFVSFDGLVNNESFQQDGLMSFAGYQYAAWYTSRVASSGILSVLYQRTSSGTTPSPVRVIDLQL